MKITVPNHNEKSTFVKTMVDKQETPIQVTQVIELGNVTELTLGHGNAYIEGNFRYYGSIYK